MRIPTWLLYASFTAFFLAAADSFVKCASGRLSNSLGLLIYGSCTFATGLGWVMVQYLRGVPLTAQPAGIFYALGVGISFAMVTVGLYLTFGAGAPLSVASPFIRLGGLVIAGMVGFLVLGEPFSFRYVGGILLIFLGLYLIVVR